MSFHLHAIFFFSSSCGGATITPVLPGHLNFSDVLQASVAPQIDDIAHRALPEVSSYLLTLRLASGKAGGIGRTDRHKSSIPLWLLVVMKRLAHSLNAWQSLERTASAKNGTPPKQRGHIGWSFSLRPKYPVYDLYLCNESTPTGVVTP